MGKKEKIFVIVLAVLLVVCLIISKVTGKKSVKPANVVIGTETTTEDETEYIDLSDPENQNNANTDTSRGTITYVEQSTTTQTTTEQVTTEAIDTEATGNIDEVGSIRENGSIQTDAPTSNEPEVQEDYSKSDTGYYDSIMPTDEFIEPSIKDTNIEYVLVGVLQGYISDNPFATNGFKNMYAKAFLPNVTDVVISDLDFNANTAIATITTNDEVKTYDITFKLLDNLLDDITLTERS